MRATARQKPDGNGSEEAGQYGYFGPAENEAHST